MAREHEAPPGPPNPCGPLKRRSESVEPFLVDDYIGRPPAPHQPTTSARIPRRRAKQTAQEFTVVLLVGLPLPLTAIHAGPAVTGHAGWLTVFWTWVGAAALTFVRTKLAAQAHERADADDHRRLARAQPSRRQTRAAECWLALCLIWTGSALLVWGPVFAAAQIGQPLPSSAVIVEVRDRGRKLPDQTFVTFAPGVGETPLRAQALAAEWHDYRPGDPLIFDAGRPSEVMFAGDYTFGAGAGRRIAVASTALLLAASLVTWRLFRPRAGE